MEFESLKQFRLKQEDSKQEQDRKKKQEEIGIVSDIDKSHKWKHQQMKDLSP